MARASLRTTPMNFTIKDGHCVEKLNIIDSHNNKRTTMAVVKLFREYLMTKNRSGDFENFSVEELDELLACFYTEISNKIEDMYRKSILIKYRNGLQRFMEKIRNDIDITNRSIFKKSTLVCKCKRKDMKQGSIVQHHPPISNENLKKIYQHLLKDHLEDPQLLQYKVFFDLMLHFGHGGCENLANLSKADFAVSTDDDGKLYVYKTTEKLTKSQNESETSSEGRMYEVKESFVCPVRSFVKYLKQLNPKCQKIFQQIRSSPVDGRYFKRQPLDHNKLDNFMSEISRAANLSQVYTNDSCRATAAQVMNCTTSKSARYIFN